MIIEDKKDEHLLLSALEFFVDYRFNANSQMSTRYSQMIQKIDQNDYAKLCERMGGKTRFAPTIDNKE